MQLRFTTGLTSEDYVSRQAWREATLERCPLHPRGGSGLARHGTYERASPPGARIARWRCPPGHCTFSLLPDCLAARLPGTLAEVEQVVRAVEQAPSLESAADGLRPDIELPGAVRWTRRRVRAVHRTLSALRGLYPQTFALVPATLSAFGEALGLEAVLVTLRAMAAPYLHGLPAPLGLCPRGDADGEARSGGQHSTGPDPPDGPR